ncbi:antitoxin Xre/MbcA/ParS toxin-binding domain-containing protein [Burkholderia sp. LMG 13014]|uniref:antitoxin Xre/MbcA/ParS toxin-binding domain-containing protein n=1 Tax=Burkholderia sp. LMG 13014 TaxID=2709306 RepID=UPI001F0581C2|nr:antitoxin Xre/MbcA/ParS toxin-binding domain-containing protein [Burkholderia sp. LMG 13014]
MRRTPKWEHLDFHSGKSHNGNYDIPIQEYGMTLNHSAGRRQPARKAAPAHALVGSNGLGALPADLDEFLVLYPPLEQRRLIRDGFEAVIIDRVAKELLRMPVQTLLASLSLPSSTILRKIQRQERLSPAESDRVARVLYLRNLAIEVFEDEARAVAWMRRPHAELAGLSPLDVLDSQPGYDRARDLLLRVIHGVSA